MLKCNFKKLIVLFFLCFTTFVSATSIKADVINDYDIKMKVQEDGIITINQKIDVNFDFDRHGIYATIPSRYNMSWTPGYVDSYYFPVKNIKVNNYPYNVEYQDNGVLIQIGDPNKYLIGKQTFEYSYQIQTKDLGLDNKQMLYFNLVGDDWDYSINKVNFNIEMPKSFTNKPEFFGPDNSKDITFKVKDDKDIVGSFNHPINPGKALTVKLDLPDDYFAYPTYISTAIISLVVMIIILIITIVLYIPRRRLRLTPVVEFNVPDNLSSAQVSYLYENRVDIKKMSSLIIYWASKGYLKIKEVNNKEKIFLFTKIRDIDDNEMQYEKDLFRKFFKSNEVKSNKIPTAFSKALPSAKLHYKKYFENKKVVFNKKNVSLIALLTFLTTIVFNIYIFIITYQYDGLLLDSGIQTLICLIITSLLNTWFIRIIDSMYIKKSVKKFFKLILCIILYPIAFFAISFIILNNYPNELLTSLIYLTMFISVIFISLIRRRTDEGVILLERILGLKDFINTAEKDRLELLVNENPEYFYDILPFAYVLGVSNKWSKKFESISIPKPYWYESDMTLFDVFIMTSIIDNSLKSVNTSVVNSLGRSVSSGIGGFTGGGGGTSGGGFGGGGGGSW